MSKPTIECGDCGLVQTEDITLTACTYCGQTLCQDCCSDHEPDCENNDELIQSNEIEEDNWQKDEEEED